MFKLFPEYSGIIGTNNGDAGTLVLQEQQIEYYFR
jgi:hypothetical protein